MDNIKLSQCSISTIFESKVGSIRFTDKRQITSNDCIQSVVPFFVPIAERYETYLKENLKSITQYLSIPTGIEMIPIGYRYFTSDGNPSPNHLLINNKKRSSTEENSKLGLLCFLINNQSKEIQLGLIQLRNEYEEIDFLPPLELTSIVCLGFKLTLHITNEKYCFGAFNSEEVTDYRRCTAFAPLTDYTTNHISLLLTKPENCFQRSLVWKKDEEDPLRVRTYCGIIALLELILSTCYNVSFYSLISPRFLSKGEDPLSFCNEIKNPLIREWIIDLLPTLLVHSDEKLRERIAKYIVPLTTQE